MIEIANAMLDAILYIGGIAFWSILFLALIIFARLKWIDRNA